ncbi:MAG: TusE/DsrC/DsvC family sulfur relay protein, partial [Alphaproteobacteria bacterium]|nr:TusE/DsrC/DsvC family sulfur relay protein [Alphaproteobacteria bacterium]
MAYEVGGTTIEHDEEGFIEDISQWTLDLANYLADEEKVEMTDEHWEVVNFLRDYYNEYQI